MPDRWNISLDSQGRMNGNSALPFSGSFSVTMDQFQVACNNPDWRWNDGEQKFEAPPAPPVYVPTPDEIMRAFELQLEQWLDSTAFLNGRWKSMESARLGAVTQDEYQAQAIPLYALWRMTWNHSFTVLAACQAGTRVIPTISELVLEVRALPDVAALNLVFPEVA